MDHLLLLETLEGLVAGNKAAGVTGLFVAHVPYGIDLDRPWMSGDQRTLRDRLRELPGVHWVTNSPSPGVSLVKIEDE